MPQSGHWKNPREIALNQQNTIIWEWHGCHSNKEIQNWFSIFCSDTLRNADVKKNSTPDPGLGLYLDAYLTCDGFTYNVTRTQGPPTPGKAVTNIQKKFNMLLVFTSYFHLQKYKNIIFRLSNLTTER